MLTRHLKPIDYDALHHNVRVPLSQFTLSEEPGAGFTTLHMDKDKVAKLGLPAVPVKLIWFGEPPATILLQCSWSKKKPDQKHVTGEQL